MATTIHYDFLDMSNFTEEEYEAERIRLRQPISEEKKQRRLAALQRVEEHRREFLERTGGTGISAEDIQEAIDWSREG
jgi:molybdopterin biosynthesis enzyme MoaB